MFVTNQPTIVRCAKICYEEYPTSVNELKESGVTYNNTKKAYSDMDCKLAKAQLSIGESSNLAQLAMTYYWSEKHKENPDPQKLKDYYDSFVILAIVAQLCIDGCKREYEVSGADEISRIKKLPSMIFQEESGGKMIRKDFPKFMEYTKEVSVTKNGKPLPYEVVKRDRDKIKSRINGDFSCPMNWVVERLDKIQGAKRTNSLDNSLFFKKLEGKPNARQVSAIYELVERYCQYVKVFNQTYDPDTSDIECLLQETEDIIEEIQKKKTSNNTTYNNLICAALGLNANARGSANKKATKYTRSLLNLLYKANKTKFLENFFSENALNMQNIFV